MQLRREDLLEQYGIHCLRITPAAGSVKTGKYRLVPLHSHLIDMGLVDFISSRPEGPIFYSPKVKGTVSATQAANVGKKVGEWVREVAGVTDPEVQPNHGWRHRFTTVAKDAGIHPDYIKVLQGHKTGDAAEGYGENTTKALNREMQKLPRYLKGF